MNSQDYHTFSWLRGTQPRWHEDALRISNPLYVWRSQVDPFAIGQWCGVLNLSLLLIWTDSRVTVDSFVVTFNSLLRHGIIHLHSLVVNMINPCFYDLPNAEGPQISFGWAIFNSIFPWAKWPPFYFGDNIFRCISTNEKFHILIKTSLKFVPIGPTDNNQALV